MRSGEEEEEEEDRKRNREGELSTRRAQRPPQGETEVGGSQGGERRPARVTGRNPRRKKSQK